MSIAKKCPVCQKDFLRTCNRSSDNCCSKACGYKFRTQNAIGKPKHKRPLEERFWEKVDKSAGPDACWLWTAQIARNGYGHFDIGGRPNLAHRISFELTYGEIPDDMYILHSCPGGLDCKKCVNPSHIRAGTPQDNMDDRSARGRQGNCRNKNLKLTAEKATEIRRLYATGWYTHQQLADMYGCSQSHLTNIINWLVWSEVP